MKQRRKTIREICHNNFQIPNVSMLTLTFDSKDMGEKSCADISITHYEFKKFIQRVNDHYQDFKYIATFSRQGNGNWHYHVMCNFDSKIKNKEITALWKKGITHISPIETRQKYDAATQYLVDNMNESADELNGKRGYLYSKNMERDIKLDSWKEEHSEKFEKAFEKVVEAKRTILYETKTHLGIKGTKVNEETGELFEVYIPDREINSLLADAGYESWDTIYTHLTSAADFSEMFSELKTATEKPKKFKRTRTEK